MKAVSDFLGLTDTPAAYAAQAGKRAQVNVAEDALEFGTVIPGFTWSEVYSGAAPSDYQWLKETCTPQKVKNGVGIIIGDYIYVLTQYNYTDTTYNFRLLRYHIPSASWALMATPPVYPTCSWSGAFSPCYDGADRIYFPLSAGTKHLRWYNISTNTWGGPSADTALGVGATETQCMCLAADGKVYVLWSTDAFQHFALYDPGANNWNDGLAQPGAHTAYALGMVRDGTDIFVMWNLTWKATIAKYDITLDVWTDNHLQAAYDYTFQGWMAWSDDRLYGVKSTDKSDVFFYSIAGNNFDDTTIPALPHNFALPGGAAKSDDSMLYLIGPGSDVYSYDGVGYWLLWSGALDYGDCLLIEQPRSDVHYVIVHTGDAGIKETVKGYWSIICTAGTWIVSMSKSMGTAYQYVRVHKGVA